MMGRKKKETIEQPKGYEVDPKAIEVPRAYLLNKKWVGIGGSIVRKGVPPNGDVVIPEATDEQYLEIAKHCKLVTIV